MRTILSILTLLLGLLTTGCSLIGLGIGASIPRYSGNASSPVAGQTVSALTPEDGEPRVRFELQDDASEIKHTACSLTPILGKPLVVIFEQGNAHTRCGSDDVAARQISVRLKTFSALSVVVELDATSRTADLVDDQRFVVEVSKRLLARTPVAETRTRTRAGSYWAMGLGVGLTIDVLASIVGIVAMSLHNAFSGMQGWGSGCSSCGM